MRSQVHDPIRQLLLGEPGARPQPRFPDARADDVFLCAVDSLRGAFHNRWQYAHSLAVAVRKRKQLLGSPSRLDESTLPLRQGCPVCRVYGGFIACAGRHGAILSAFARSTSVLVAIRRVHTQQRAVMCPRQIRVKTARLPGFDP